MGTAIAWTLVRDRFWGRSLVNVVIDIPFALPTVVAGLVLLSLYGPKSPVGVNVARKDVVRLTNDTQPSLFFRFRDFVGRYPMHCHNVIHEDHAMMNRFDIDDTGHTNSNP